MTRVIFLSLVEIAVVKRNQRDQKREEIKREKRVKEKRGKEKKQ